MLVWCTSLTSDNQYTYNFIPVCASPLSEQNYSDANGGHVKAFGIILYIIYLCNNLFNIYIILTNNHMYISRSPFKKLKQ